MWDFETVLTSKWHQSMIKMRLLEMIRTYRDSPGVQPYMLIHLGPHVDHVLKVNSHRSLVLETSRACFSLQAEHYARQKLTLRSGKLIRQRVERWMTVVTAVTVVTTVFIAPDFTISPHLQHLATSCSASGLLAPDQEIIKIIGLVVLACLGAA